MSDTTNPVHPKGPVIQLGKLRIAGGWAILILLAVMAGIVTLVVRVRPALSGWPIWVSAAIWIIFVMYWGSSAKNSAPSTAQETVKSRQFHELLLNAGFLLLFIPVWGLSTQIWPRKLIYMLAGLLIQTFFFSLAVWARRHLGKNWSGAISTKFNHQLIRTGPYRVIRHPIYTAMLGMFAGSAIVSGTPHAIIAFGIIAASYSRKIPMEERHLNAVFGEEYRMYRRESAALVPWLL